MLQSNEKYCILKSTLSIKLSRDKIKFRYQEYLKSSINFFREYAK